MAIEAVNKVQHFFESLHAGITFENFTDNEIARIIQILTSLKLPLVNVKVIRKARFGDLVRVPGTKSAYFDEYENAMFLGEPVPGTDWKAGTISLSEMYFRDVPTDFTLKETLAHEIAHSISPLAYINTDPKVRKRKSNLYSKKQAEEIFNFVQQIGHRLHARGNGFPSYNMQNYYYNLRVGRHAPGSKMHFMFADEMFACIIQNYVERPEALRAVLTGAEFKQVEQIVKKLRKSGPKIYSRKKGSEIPGVTPLAKVQVN